MKQAPVPPKRLQGGNSALVRQPDTLRDLVRQIVAVARPLKIVLFGSRACGDAKPDSDYDLMVLMPNGAHRRHTSQKLHQNVLVTGISYDILVATPKDFARYGYHPSLVYKYILDEGMDLYVA